MIWPESSKDRNAVAAEEGRYAHEVRCTRGVV